VRGFLTIQQRSTGAGVALASIEMVLVLVLALLLMGVLQLGLLYSPVVQMAALLLRWAWFLIAQVDLLLLCWCCLQR
jgi:hypothetical protein